MRVQVPPRAPHEKIPQYADIAGFSLFINTLNDFEFPVFLGNGVLKKGLHNKNSAQIANKKC